MQRILQPLSFGAIIAAVLILIVLLLILAVLTALIVLLVLSVLLLTSRTIGAGRRKNRDRMHIVRYADSNRK